jgi:hypothetical protein
MANYRDKFGLTFPNTFCSLNERVRIFVDALQGERDSRAKEAVLLTNILNYIVAGAIIFMGIGAVAVALPAISFDILGRHLDTSEKWFVTSPLAISGVLYFLANNLKLREWSSWNYWRVDELNNILRDLMISPPEMSEAKLANALKKYRKMVKELGEQADAITQAFTKRPSHQTCSNPDGDDTDKG